HLDGRFQKRLMITRKLVLAGHGLFFACCAFSLQPESAAQNVERPWFRDATKEYGPIGDGPPAFADLDGDGYPDLVCNGKIFKNDRGRRFIDVTKDTGIAASGAAVIDDVDNDGRPDIYFCGGTGSLYRNLGNLRFEDW